MKTVNSEQHIVNREKYKTKGPLAKVPKVVTPTKVGVQN